MFIVIYRAHGKLNCETQYIGPFSDFAEAYDTACELPALGQPSNDQYPGVKFVQELSKSAN